MQVDSSFDYYTVCNTYIHEKTSETIQNKFFNVTLPLTLPRPRPDPFPFSLKNNIEYTILKDKKDIPI